MARFVRILLIVLGSIEALLCMAFLLSIPFALALWPWPAMSPLSYLLLAALFATAATVTLWPVFIQEDSAITGAALVYTVALTPLAIFGFQNGARTGNQSFAIFGGVMLLGALIGIMLLVWSWRLPFHDQRSLPGITRWSFILFAIALLVSGAQLILRRPNILPWNITPELSVIFGWLFIGALGLFLYALYRPYWAMASGALASFLAYDLVLIVPFLRRIPSIEPQFRLSMILYLIAIVTSAGLAIYTLFIDQKTRVWGRA